MDAKPDLDPLAGFGSADSSILVPELRDPRRINAELIRRLDQGDAHVRIEGAEGHRLLLAGLTGSWRATVVIQGWSGPELCFGMNAPGVTVVCRGSSGDGAGSGMRAGTLALMGPSGTAVGYHQEGGVIIAAEIVGPRAGLGMLGGDLFLFNFAKSFAGERQRGGRLFYPAHRVGRCWGWKATGGERHWIPGMWDNRRDLAARLVIDQAARLSARFSTRRDD